MSEYNMGIIRQTTQLHWDWLEFLVALDSRNSLSFVKTSVKEKSKLKRTEPFQGIFRGWNTPFLDDKSI